MDALLDGLGLGKLERLEWLRGRTLSKVDLGPEYRIRNEVLKLCTGEPAYVPAQFGGEALRRLLDERRSAIAPPALKLWRSQSQNEHNKDLDQIYSSFVHLHGTDSLA